MAPVPGQPWHHPQLHPHQVQGGISHSQHNIQHTHREHCNLWRNFRDVQDNWASVSSIIDFYGDNKVQSVSACLVHDNLTTLPRTGSWRLRAPAAGMTPTCWSWATSDCRWSSHVPRCQACYHVSCVTCHDRCHVPSVTCHATRHVSRCRCGQCSRLLSSSPRTCGPSGKTHVTP